MKSLVLVFLTSVFLSGCMNNYSYSPVRDDNEAVLERFRWAQEQQRKASVGQAEYVQRGEGRNVQEPFSETFTCDGYVEWANGGERSQQLRIEIEESRASINNVSFYSDGSVSGRNYRVDRSYSFDDESAKGSLTIIQGYNFSDYEFYFDRESGVLTYSSNELENGNDKEFTYRARCR